MNRHEIALKKLAEGTVIPATPLALNENRIFNEEGQRLLMKYYLNSGAGGIATAVHTTQFEIRYPEYNLYEPVLKIVSEEIDKFEQEHNTVVIKVAGVCGPVEQALGEVEIAKKYGYDAVLLSVGGLDSLTEDELIERTKLVAKEIPVIGFYLQPSAGGRLLSYDYWQKLCAIENVVAIKSAPFNRYQTMDVVRAVAMSDRCDDITLYTGNDDNIVVDLLTKYKFTKNGKTVVKSFEGGLLGHWCVWTKKVVEMFAEIKEAKKGDMIPAKLLTLAAEVTDANAVVFDAANAYAGNRAGIHEILRRQGIMQNIYCLDSKEKLSIGQSEELDRIYEMYPHLTDDAFVAENIADWMK